MAVLEAHVADGVATLTLNRPEARNALDDALKQALADALPPLVADPAVRALVLTGAGGAFCAGGDLRSMQAVRATMTPAAWRGRMQALHPVVLGLHRCPKPVIAAVDGPAFGAGFSLALLADFVLASSRASFCMSFMRVGLVPDFGAMYSLPRVVGTQRARELMLSAREVGAEEALRLGIAMEVHAPGQLLARGRELAESLTAASPLAVAKVKRALRLALAEPMTEHLEREAGDQAECFVSDDHVQAVQRFLDKQPARFRWPPRRDPT